MATYTRGLGDLLGAGNWLADTIVCLLLKTGYTYNVDHDYISDLTPGTNEVSAAGYARQTLAGKAVNISDANDRVELDADDAVFTAVAAGQTVDAAVVARSTGADASSPLISHHDVTNTPTNGGNLTVQWAAAGIVNVTPA